MTYRKQSLIFKVGPVCAYLATICILIGYAGNGMIRQKSVDLGIWYYTACSETTGCKPVSYKSEFDKKEIDEVTYLYYVDWQVTVTLCGVFIAIVDTSYVCQLLRKAHIKKTTPIIIAFSAVTCIWLLQISVFEGALQLENVSSSSTRQNNITYLFPWSLFALFLGGLLVLFVTMINYVYEIVTPKDLNCSALMTSYHPFDKIGLTLSAISLVFQVCAHGSNSFHVYSNTNSNTSTASRESYGIWYVTYCDWDDECKSVSRFEYGEHDGSTYFRILNGMVNTTVSTVFTAVVVVMYVMFWIKRIGNSLRVHWIAFSIIPGAILIHYCALSASQLIALSGDQNEQLSFSVEFPWGLFLLIVAAVLSLVVGGINIARLLFERKQVYESHVSTSNDIMNDSARL